jgi:hypothetical protein
MTQRIDDEELDLRATHRHPLPAGVKGCMYEGTVHQHGGVYYTCSADPSVPVGRDPSPALRALMPDTYEIREPTPVGYARGLSYAIAPARSRVSVLRNAIAERDESSQINTNPLLRQTVGPDLALQDATPDEQADFAIQLAEERAGRQLTAAEIREKVKPVYHYLRAMVARADAREARERASVEREAGGASLLDEVLAETEALPGVVRFSMNCPVLPTELTDAASCDS